MKKVVFLKTNILTLDSERVKSNANHGAHLGQQFTLGADVLEPKPVHLHLPALLPLRGRLPFTGHQTGGIGTH